MSRLARLFSDTASRVGSARAREIRQRVYVYARIYGRWFIVRARGVAVLATDTQHTHSQTRAQTYFRSNLERLCVFVYSWRRTDDKVSINGPQASLHKPLTTTSEASHQQRVMNVVLY